MTYQFPKFRRNSVYAALFGATIAVIQMPVVNAETGANDVAKPRPLMLAATCNPCAKAKCNPCAKATCNPCAKAKCNPCAKATCNSCAKAKCNPCAKANPCNPCAKKNPCAASKACNPCNPCAAKKKANMIVSGTLVDTRCYGSDNRNTTDNHFMGGGNIVKGCAAACAQMGIPVAVLDGGSGGALIALASPAPGFAPYMGQEARVSGIEVTSGLMLPTKMEVRTASGWKEVNVKGMM